MKIKDLLNEDIKGILSEDSIVAIQEAFDNKVAEALEEQDSIYADKLKELIGSIDKDHTKKLHRVVESVDKNNASKLINVVKQYNRSLKVEAKNTKKQVIKSVSAYLDEFLLESISKEDLAQAVKNKTAFNILSELRGILSVDSALMQESVKSAIFDGKAQLDKLAKDKKEIGTAYKELYESTQQLKIDLFLEKKLSTFSEAKQKFVRSTFKGKPLDHIEENFEYTVRLFERSEKDKLKNLKTEAIEQRKVKPDFVPQQKIVEENVNNNEAADMYVSELSKVFSKNR